MKKNLLFITLGTAIFFAGPIFAQTEKEVNKMLKNLHWLGHDSFRFDGCLKILKKRIYYLSLMSILTISLRKMSPR